MDFFRGRYSWRKLRVFLDQLPADSHYVEAVSNDPHQAENVLDGPQRPAPPPSLHRYSPELARLTEIVERLDTVASVLIGTATGKVPPTVPLPRPVTEIDRMRRARSRQRHESLVSEVEAAQARWLENQREGRL